MISHSTGLKIAGLTPGVLIITSYFSPLIGRSFSNVVLSYA
jgi:hypothetical protein